MPHTVFNLDQLSEYLHIPPAELDRLVKEGQIPFRRQGERVVFLRRDVDAWASRRILGFKEGSLRDYHRVSSAKAHDLSARHAILPELITRERIDPKLTSKTRASVIRDMVRLADATGLVIYSDELLKGVEDRERMGTTALTGGIALLHPPHHDPYLFEDSFVVIARSVQPIPFGSLDGQTTDIFFLVCCQDDRIHLHVLARLCMVCHHTELLFRLRECETAGDMLDAIAAAEDEVIRGL